MENINDFINTVAVLREREKLFQKLIVANNLPAAILQTQRVIETEAEIDTMLEKHYADRRTKEPAE